MLEPSVRYDRKWVSMSQKDNSQIEVRAVGKLRSCFQHKFGTPRQGSLTPSSRAIVELDKKWIGPGSLESLKSFSHVWLICWLHHFNHDRKHVKSKIHPPRLEGEKRGVFATRSPHHPNPIGLTLARLEEVGEYHLVVSEVDLIEGTPVLDVKPYVPAADRPEVFSHGWLAQVPDKKWPIHFQAQALQEISELYHQGALQPQPEEFVQLIREVIQEDPRPLSYRGKDEEPYAVHLYDVNVIFEFHGDGFTVTRCEPKNQGHRSKTISDNAAGPTNRA